MKNNPPAWLYRRTRILNVLHLFGIANPHSQMNEEEKSCLRKYALNKMLALEIGTYMGVTAAVIATALAENGLIFCVDPFESRNKQQNPGLTIAQRELKRKHIFHKVKFLLGYSHDPDIISRIPANLDFILVDGDHSYEGLENDWQIVRSKLAANGVVCLHDTSIPEKEPYRNFGSVAYFEKVIKSDMDFVHIEKAYSMNVLKKK